MGCQGSKAPTAPKPVGATILQQQKGEGINVVKAETSLAANPLMQDVTRAPPATISLESTALPRNKESSEGIVLAQMRFALGQDVECRDPSSCFQGLSQWKAGTVTCIDPLKVTRDGHHPFAYDWGEVRPLQQSFALGQRVECRDSGSCFEGLSSWKPGIVTCIDPLKVSRDGHHTFAYEWSEVRASQEPFSLDEQEVSRASPLPQPDDSGAQTVPSVAVVSAQKTDGNSSSIARATIFSCAHFCRTTEADSEILLDIIPPESS
jgi:hypothetical protein